MSENIHFGKLAKYEIVNIVLFGIILAATLFVYGVVALLQAKCIFVGRGNFPTGSLAYFYGAQARLISAIYIGAGISIFSLVFLKRIVRSQKASLYATLLSWLGVLLVLFGLIALVAIMLSILF
jgi:hypothetical protein